jgi:hypothetical protein
MARRKKAASLSTLDREVADLVSSFEDGHAFPLPELGMTMADGGEPTTKPTTRKEEK